jgi:hypothetical protein
MEMTSELKGRLDMIPAHCRAEMSNYIEHGRRPGNFLCAVLTNNLFMTHVHADDVNRDRIMDYITFLSSYAPPNCFGSRVKFEAWIEDATERRAMAHLAGPQP